MGTQLPKSRSSGPGSTRDRAGMARGGAAMAAVLTFACFAVPVLLTCSPARTPAATGPERIPRRQREASQRRQLNASGLNTALAFDLYRDLAAKAGADPGAQRQQQQQQQQQQQKHNILFSPLGLASALALLCRVSGSESRSQALEALGVAANSTERSVEATVSALADLQRSLSFQEGGGGGGDVREAETEDGEEADAAIGEAAPGRDAGDGTDAGDGAAGRARPQNGTRAGGRLRVWSDLRVDGKSPDYNSFLSRPQLSGPTTVNISFETLTKELEASDRLILNNYIYFKGALPFERRHTVRRPFQLNATASAEVPMMFRDDSSEVMMLYDTNCSATAVRLPVGERLASLLLLPKAELQPLEDCLSDSRMRFWLSNLKPGRAEIRFPRFQLRKSYSLENLLRSAGVSSVFSHAADFSGISQGKMPKLIKAPHEVSLEVEETKSGEGGGSDVSLDFSVPPRITFDRPFMLIIYDVVTGLVLLMGKVIDPTGV